MKHTSGFFAVRFNDGARDRYFAGGDYRRPKYDDFPIYSTVEGEAEQDVARLRMFNAAAGQFQLDIYGEVADALAQALKGGLPPHPRSRELSETIMPSASAVVR